MIFLTLFFCGIMVNKSGDDMNIEKIKHLLAKNNRVIFKLYSLEYTIEIVDNQVRIYSLTYPDNIKFYSTLEELVNNFRVYNESLFDVEDRIAVYE